MRLGLLRTLSPGILCSSEQLHTHMCSLSCLYQNGFPRGPEVSLSIGKLWLCFLRLWFVTSYTPRWPYYLLLDRSPKRKRSDFFKGTRVLKLKFHTRSAAGIEKAVAIPTLSSSALFSAFLPFSLSTQLAPHQPEPWES